MGDNAWKLLSILIGVVLVPTFGWVWNIHTEVSNIGVEFAHSQVQVSDIKDSVNKLEDHTTDIAVIQRDLTHLNEKMDELKVLLIKLNEK